MLDIEELQMEDFLQKQFKKVTKEFDTYFLYKGTNKEVTIKIKDIFAFVAGQDSLGMHVKDCLFDYYSALPEGKIIVTSFSSQDAIKLIPIGDSAKTMAEWIMRIDNFSDKMAFGSPSIFTKSIGFSLENEPSIAIKYGSEEIFSIKCLEDVAKLNQFQNNAYEMINEIKNHILSIVKRYDQWAELLETGIIMFGNLYLFKVTRSAHTWVVYFFRSYNERGIMHVDKIEESAEKVYELAESYAIEERLSSLFG